MITIPDLPFTEQIRPLTNLKKLLSSAILSAISQLMQEMQEGQPDHMTHAAVHMDSIEVFIS